MIIRPVLAELLTVLVVGNGWVMKNIVYFMLFLCASCFAQEDPHPCDVVMIDSRQSSVVLASSESGNYVARLEYFDKAGEVKLYILEWIGESFRLKKNISLDQGFPNKLMVSDAGNVILIGKRSGLSNIDEIKIFSQEKDSSITIETISPLVSTVSENCKMRKPWICWSYDARISNETINILDLKGFDVRIDLASGKYIRSKSVDICEAYK